MDIRDADIHEAAELVRVGRVLSVTVGLSGVGPPPTLTIIHVLAIWMYPGAPCRHPAQDAASEDFFVKSDRSFNIGDGEKMRDSKPVMRGI